MMSEKTFIGVMATYFDVAMFGVTGSLPDESTFHAMIPNTTSAANTGKTHGLRGLLCGGSCGKGGALYLEPL
jgi:hypothetical protein